MAFFGAVCFDRKQERAKGREKESAANALGASLAEARPDPPQ